MLYINGEPQKRAVGGFLYINGEPQLGPMRGGVLKSGQTTQYNSELDDGYYEKGLAKSYTVYSTGQYAGTTNITVVHLTASDISFTAATKTIAQVAAGLAMFKTGETLVVTGSGSNDGTYTIATGNVAAEIVVTENLIDEVAGASVSLAKREAISNNCVFDNNTGLTWTRYNPVKLGSTGDGQMIYTGQLYDAFQYEAAANTSSLGGYTDWRIPNLKELQTLEDGEAATGLPDSTAFPSIATGAYLSSTSAPTNTGAFMPIIFNTLASSLSAKTNGGFVLLVRGG